MNIELAGVFLLDCGQNKNWQTYEHRTSWCFLYWTADRTRTGKHMNIELAGVFYWTADSTRTGKHMNIELSGVFYWTADSTRTGRHMNIELAGVFFIGLWIEQELANT